MDERPPTTFDIEREIALARTFVRLADTLVSDYDVEHLLADLADSCVALLDVDAAGILLLIGDRLQLAASSSQAMRDVEIFQVQADEGPCLDCVRLAEPVSTPDLEHHGQWPRFTPVALRRGLRAVYSMPMRLRGEVIGGLNLFRRSTYVWSDADVLVAKALADVATIGILQERASARSSEVQSQLQRALDSRVLIEQAKGVLIARTRTDPQGAFELLRGYARHHNLPLRDVAQAVVSGELPIGQFTVPRVTVEPAPRGRGGGSSIPPGV